MSQEDLAFLIKSYSRFIYFQTDEEDRAFHMVKNICKNKKSNKIFVFNATVGLMPLDELLDNLGANGVRVHPKASRGADQNACFEEIYKDNPNEDPDRDPKIGMKYIYLITDPERWLADQHIQRRILNVAHSAAANLDIVKIVIFVGSKRHIPDKLAKFIEVIVDTGLTDEEIEETVGATCDKVEVPTPPLDIFKGMTTWEIKQSITQSFRKRLRDTGVGDRLDLHYLKDSRKRALRKTDLLTYIDTTDNSFKEVGGIQRFKDWASQTKACWTPEGQAFGLKPPRGVLSVGVWGCGKSLSAKALANAWGLPVIQLEMGKLRGMAQGASESNVYTALRLVENVGPCVLWLDEAEKSLSGAASSSMTDGGTTNRMLGIFSTWIQETKAQVTLVLTANSLGTLPVEFVNRMDERFFFGLPSVSERIEIIKIHLGKIGRGALTSKFNLAELSEAASGLVGREIAQAVGAALLESFSTGKTDLHEGILLSQFKRKPRISKTMADEIAALTAWVGFDKEADDGIRARFASAPEVKASLKLV